MTTSLMKFFIHDALVQEVIIRKENFHKQPQISFKERTYNAGRFFEGVTNIVNKQSDSSEE